MSTNAIAPYAGLIEAIEAIEAVGLGTIESHIERLTDRLKASLGNRCLSPTEYESGLVAFEVDDVEAFVERADAAGIVVRELPSETVRASVHAFNTAEEIDTLCALV